MSETKNEIVKRLSNEVTKTIDHRIQSGELKNAKQFLKQWLAPDTYRVWRRTEEELWKLCGTKITTYFNTRIIFNVMMKAKCEEVGIKFNLIYQSEFIIHALFCVILYLKFGEEPKESLGGYAV